MRTSNDEYDQDGYVLNGFDYELQVWVRNGIVQPCGHPASMRKRGLPCCAADGYKGINIRPARLNAGLEGKR